MGHGFNYLVANSETAPATTLLDRYYCKKSQTEFVYGQANGAIAIYDGVKIDNDGQLIKIDTTLSASEPSAVGFAQVAVADNEHAWVAVKGGGSGKGIKANVAASITAGAKMTTTGTAGAIGAGGDLIQGLSTVTTTTDAAAVEIYMPIEPVTNAQD